MSLHFYSVAEANAVLPQVRALVARMLAAREEVIQVQPRLWPAVQKAVHNGGSRTVTEATRQIIAIQDALLKLKEMSIQVQDLNTGLVDFPARRGGRTIWLCWKYDEPAVQFWHDLDAGFAGRQPIKEWE